MDMDFGIEIIEIVADKQHSVAKPCKAIMCMCYIGWEGDFAWVQDN